MKAPTQVNRALLAADRAAVDICALLETVARHGATVAAAHFDLDSATVDQVAAAYPTLGRRARAAADPAFGPTCPCPSCRAARARRPRPKAVPEPCRRHDSVELTDPERQIVEANIGLVGWCMRVMRVTGPDRDDSFQDGLLGLMRAAQKYDPSTGFRFSTYATYWIRQGIQQGRGDAEGINYRRASHQRVSYVAPASLDHELGTDDSFTLTDLIPADVDVESEALAPVARSQLERDLQSCCYDSLDLAIVEGIAAGRPISTIATLGGVSSTTARDRLKVIRERARRRALK